MSSACVFRVTSVESLYWMKHFSLRLAVINVCPVLVPSELLLSTHLPTSEGWTAELTVGLWLVVTTTGFEPTGVDLTRFEALHHNYSATPRSDRYRARNPGIPKRSLGQLSNQPMRTLIMFFLSRRIDGAK